MFRQILHIDLDAFFVSMEQVLNPALRGKPVVVGGHPGIRGVVASASYEARAFGLSAGMPLSTAYRLCPRATFLPGSFSRYRDASEKFMAILADFTPDVEPLGIDEAYLDITGFEPIYGCSQETAHHIKHRIKNELGITASVGIAPSKVVSKVASGLSKPDGLIEVKPGEEQPFLAPLAVAKLPCVGPKSEQKLKGIGITTIGELASRPAHLLKQLFGTVGEVLHRYANGVDERRVEPPARAKSISRETTFAQDTLDHHFLKATLRYLSERVGAELRKEGRRAKCITLKLRYADFQSVSRSCTLKQSSNSDQAIFEVGLKLLERTLDQRRQLVRLIGIGVSDLVSGEKQLNMLDFTSQRLECLNKAIDRIRKKYGFTTIQTGGTLPLGDVFPTENGDYVLKTPCLSH